MKRIFVVGAPSSTIESIRTALVKILPKSATITDLDDGVLVECKVLDDTILGDIEEAIPGSKVEDHSIESRYLLVDLVNRNVVHTGDREECITKVSDLDSFAVVKEDDFDDSNMLEFDESKLNKPRIKFNTQ